MKKRDARGNKKTGNNFKFFAVAFILLVAVSFIYFLSVNNKTLEKEKPLEGKEQKGLLNTVADFFSFKWVIELFRVEGPVVQAPATALEDCDVLLARGNITSYGCDHDTCCGPKSGPFLNADGSVYYTCSSSPGGTGTPCSSSAGGTGFCFEKNDIFSESCWGFNPLTRLSDIYCSHKTATCSNWCYQVGFPNYYARCIECGDETTDRPMEDCDKGKKCANLISCTTEEDCADGSACIPRNIGKCTSGHFCNELNPCLDGSECKIECYNNCKDKPCTADSECGEDFCNTDDVFKHVCINPGKLNAYCSIELKEDCGEDYCRRDWCRCDYSTMPVFSYCGLCFDRWCENAECKEKTETKKTYCENSISQEDINGDGKKNWQDYCKNTKQADSNVDYPHEGFCMCTSYCGECQKCDVGIFTLQTQYLECVPVADGEKCKKEISLEFEVDGVCKDGVCIIKDCNPAPNQCQDCDTSVDPPVLKPKKEWTKCKTDDSKDGYCKNEKCIEACQALNLGQSCGSAQSPGMKCCKSEEQCCSDPDAGPGKEVCCKIGADQQNPITKCGKFGAPGQYTSQCNPNKCPEASGNSSKTIRCPGTGDGDRNTCCSQDAPICMSYNVILGPKVYYCGKNECDFGPDKTSGTDDDLEFECGSGTFTNGKLCCKKDSEKCKVTSGYPRCITKKCPDNTYTECTGQAGSVFGLDGLLEAFLCCKNGLEICGYHPNGHPRCINIPSNTGNPISSPQTSIYMVRNKDSFSLNGIAYVIKPHINFSMDVYVTLNYSIYINQGYDITQLESYKYNEHEIVMESCNSTLLDSISQNASINRTFINFKDEITMEIPKNALTNNTEIIIEKYNLSECYVIEKKDDSYDFLRMFEETPKTEERTIDSGSSSGGGTSIRALAINPEQLKSGYSEFLASKDSLNIQAGSLKKEKHSVKINMLDVKNKKINLVIESNPIIMNLSLGEKTKVDLDNDLIYDILIEFISIKALKAEIYIKEISETAVKTEIVKLNETSEEKPYVIEKSKTEWINNVLLTGLIIVIVIIIILILFRRKRKAFYKNIRKSKR